MPIINLPSLEECPKLPILKLILVYILETRTMGISERIKFRFGKNDNDVATHIQVIEILRKAEKLFPLTVWNYQNREYALAELIDGYEPDRTAFDLVNMVINKIGGRSQTPYLQTEYRLSNENVKKYNLWSQQNEAFPSNEHADILIRACENNNFTMSLLEACIAMQLPLTVRYLLQIMTLTQEEISKLRLRMVNKFNLNSLQCYLKDFNNEQLNNFLYAPAMPQSDETLFSNLVLSDRAMDDDEKNTYQMKNLEKLLRAYPFLLKNVSLEAFFSPMKARESQKSLSAFIWVLTEAGRSSQVLLSLILDNNPQLMTCLIEEKLFQPVLPGDCSHFYYLVSHSHNWPLVDRILELKPELWASLPLSILLERNSKKIPFLEFLVGEKKADRFWRDLITVRKQDILKGLTADYLLELYPRKVYCPYEHLLGVFLQRQENILLDLLKMRPKLIDEIVEKLLQAAREPKEILDSIKDFFHKFYSESQLEILELMLSHSQKLFEYTCATFSYFEHRHDLISWLVRYSVGCKILNKILDARPDLLKIDNQILSMRDFSYAIVFPENHNFLKKIYMNHPSQIKFLDFEKYGKEDGSYVKDRLPIIVYLASSKEGVELAKKLYEHKPNIFKPAELLKLENQTAMPFLYRMTMTANGIDLLLSLVEESRIKKWISKFKLEKTTSKVGSLINATVLCAAVKESHEEVYGKESSGTSCLYNLFIHPKGRLILKNFIYQQPTLLKSIIQMLNEKDKEFVEKIIPIKGNDSIMKALYGEIPELAQAIEGLDPLQVLEERLEQRNADLPRVL